MNDDDDNGDQSQKPSERNDYCEKECMWKAGENENNG